jgi:serine/threonine protein kinase
MNHPPADSGPHQSAAQPPVSSSEPSEDATRIISLPKAAAPDVNDNATVIASPKSLPTPESPPAPVTQFPRTRAAPPGASTPIPSEPGTVSATDNSLLPIGTRVAEFEISRLIGQGGFGVVYEAWDHTLERVVAIKEYMPSSLANRQADGSVVPLSERHKETFDLGMRSFINEARLLAQFDHPALLKVYRFWQERGTTYMVMPCYKGDTLKEALLAKKDQVNEEWLMGVIDGVTQALAVMHRASCYHRDIAPDNILLLENSGLPVVLDFGAARRVITDKTQAITVILKPGYAPIEQYAETPDMSQGAWTDVYALSAVMHVAITGRSPPPSVARMLNDRYVPLAGNAALHARFSDRLLAAVDAGLAVRPEARPQSMAQFRMALGLPTVDEATTSQTTKAMSARSPIHSAPSASAAKPSNQPLSAAQQTKKPPLALIAAGAAGLVIAAAGAWWWSNNAAPKPSAVNPTGAQPADQVVAASSGAAKPPPAPAAVAAPPFSVSQSLGNLQQTAKGGFEVSAKPGKPEVRISKDKLEFQIQSNKAGFAYVYLLNTVGELYLLFPNALDKRNRIEPGATLSLPKTSWAMNADGPAGTDEFVVLVSEYERDLKTSGIQYEGVFGQFSLKILEALEAARGTGPSPLLGAPICPGGTPCADNYGVSSFKIVEK